MMTDPSPAAEDNKDSRTRNPLRLFGRWLRRVPVRDPVELRNAPMLQVLLLIFGIFFPLSMLPHLLTRGDMPIDVMAELKNVAAIAMIWTSFALVRRGRFRLGAGLFIWMTLALMTLSYQRYGLKAELAIQVTQVFPIVLGGLLLGRRTLWTIVLALLCILGVGAVTDTLNGAPGQGEGVAATFNFIRCGLGFVVVGVILDRAVSALRETLVLSNRRGEELQRMREALQLEIVEKERSQDQLIHAHRVEAVGRLSSGIAHDVNNILGVIMGYASRADTAESLPVAIDSLDGIKLAAQRGAMTIRRILSFGREQAASGDVVDVRTVVNDMLPLIQHVFGQRVTLRLSIAAEPMPVQLDRSEFEMVMLNLATNARDALPDGGTVCITAKVEGDQVSFSMRDDGIGMSEHTRDRLFEMFYTTKPEGLGSGIGMAVVKRFVDHAAGRIDIHSTEGEGTCVLVRLPLAADTAAVAPLGITASIAGLRVLLVEDDEALRPLLAEALRNGAAEVFATGSGREAVDMARSLQHLDVLVSDFRLPDASGSEVFEQVTAIHPKIHCLIISTSENAAKIRTEGCAAVQLLAKPFAPARLVEAVGSVVSHRLRQA